MSNINKEFMSGATTSTNTIISILKKDSNDRTEGENQLLLPLFK